MPLILSLQVPGSFWRSALVKTRNTSYLLLILFYWGNLSAEEVLKNMIFGSVTNGKTYPRGYFLRRATALLVVMVFLLVDSVRYAPQGYASSVAAAADSTSAPFSISKELGSVDEVYHASRDSYLGTRATENQNEDSVPSPESRKTIIFIQDAHDSLEAQENIAKLIGTLVKEKGIKTVFEEGYEGSVPTDKFFGFIKDPKIKQKVSYFLLDKLRIGGAEYAHINRTSDFKLIGVEDLKLYGENIKCYQESSKNRKDIEEDLGELFSQITTLANQYFPKELKNWLKRKELFSEGKLPLLNYLEELHALYLKSLRNHSGQAFVQAYAAISVLLQAQTAHDPDLIRHLNALDSKEVFEEITQLETELSNDFLQDERDRQIFTYYQGLNLLKRLSRIELTQAEYAAAQGVLQNLKTQKMADFIALLTHRSLVLSKAWEQHIQDAIRFYSVAYGRERSVDSRLREFLQGKEDTAILVFGGFHTNGIKEILKQQGLSYVVISPRITSIDKKHQDYYKQLMSMGQHSFEVPFLTARANKPPSVFFSAAVAANEAPVRSELRAIASSVEALGDHPDPQLIERGLASSQTQSMSATTGISSFRSEMREQEKAGKRERAPQISKKERKRTGVSKWDLLDAFKVQIAGLPEAVVDQLRSTQDLGEWRRILREAKVEYGDAIDGKFFQDVVKTLLERRSMSATEKMVSNRLRRGDNGRYLVCYLGQDFDYIIKTYYDPTKKQDVRVNWLEAFDYYARPRLRDLAVPTFVVDAVEQRQKPFTFIMEDGSRRSTDVAIIQRKMTPLLEYLKRLVRSGKTRKAETLINEFKKTMIAMFRRGVVDADFGGLLANYGVDEKTGRILVFDFGDLTAGTESAYEMTDFLDEVTNKYIEDGLRDHVSDEIADYFKTNKFVESDFKDTSGNYLFGVDYDANHAEAFTMTFPYSETEVRDMFANNSVHRSEVRGWREALNQFLENDREDNLFRPVTVGKLSTGVVVTFLGMALSGSAAGSVAFFASFWIVLTALRNMFVDLRAYHEVYKVWSLEAIRKCKLSNDLMFSGLSSIPIVLSKIYLSNGAANYFNWPSWGNVLADIVVVTIVGGIPNYYQRLLRNYPGKVARRDFWRSLVMSLGAYGFFGGLYLLNGIQTIIPSAAAFAVARKFIGEGWAAYSEYEEITDFFRKEKAEGRRSEVRAERDDIRELEERLEKRKFRLVPVEGIPVHLKGLEERYGLGKVFKVEKIMKSRGADDLEVGLIFHTAKGVFFVKKMYVPGSREPLGAEEARYVAAYVQHLQGQGVPIPMILQEKGQDLLTEVVDPNTGRPVFYTVEKEVPGRQVFRDQAGTEELKKAARTLAEIHSAGRSWKFAAPKDFRHYDVAENAKGFPEKIQEAEFRPAMARTLEPEDQRLVTRVLEKTTPVLLKTAQSLHKEPIMSDFNFSNMIFSEDLTKIAGIFDVDQVRLGYRFEEFLPLLFFGAIDLKLYGDHAAEELAVLVKAYQEVAADPLSPAEIDALPNHCLFQAAKSVISAIPINAASETEATRTKRRVSLQLLKQIYPQLSKYMGENGVHYSSAFTLPLQTQIREEKSSGMIQKKFGQGADNSSIRSEVRGWFGEQLKSFVFKWPSKENSGLIKDISSYWTLVVMSALLLGGVGVLAGLLMFLVRTVGRSIFYLRNSGTPRFHREKPFLTNAIYYPIVPLSFFVAEIMFLYFFDTIPSIKNIIMTPLLLVDHPSVLLIFLKWNLLAFSSSLCWGLVIGFVPKLLTEKEPKTKSYRTYWIKKRANSTISLLEMGWLFSPVISLIAFFAVTLHEYFHTWAAKTAHRFDKRHPLSNFETHFFSGVAKFNTIIPFGISQKWDSIISLAGPLAELLVALGSFSMIIFGSTYFLWPLVLKLELFWVGANFLFVTGDFKHAILFFWQGQYLSEEIQSRNPELQQFIHVKSAPFKGPYAGSFLLRTTTGNYWVLKKGFSEEARRIEGLELFKKDEFNFMGDAYEFFQIMRHPSNLYQQIIDGDARKLITASGLPHSPPNNAFVRSEMRESHLSEAEWILLRESDEKEGLISKRERNDDRIKRQVVQLETALDKGEESGRNARAVAKAAQIIADLNAKKTKFKGEEVHILSGVSQDAKVIGRIDRKIAETYGYIHETANVVLFTSDGKVILQLRNKDTYDDHLAMYGGHLEVGEAHGESALAEATQETGLDRFENGLIPLGFESYDEAGDNNRERRSWFALRLTAEEWETMKKKKAEDEKEAGASRLTDDRVTYKKKLSRLWNQGRGEVAGVYQFTVDEITAAPQGPHPDPKFSGKNNRFLWVEDTFQGRPESDRTKAFFTPDALDRLVKNPELWGKVRELARAEMRGIENDKDLAFLRELGLKAVLFSEAGNNPTVERFGNKGRNLVRMWLEKLPVPGGAIIPSEAVAEYVKSPQSLPPFSRGRENAFLPAVLYVRSAPPVTMPGAMDSIKVRTFGELERAMEAVMNSWNSPQAKAFRGANKTAEDVYPAVVIQKAVDGTKTQETSGSGVFFTRDPDTGEKILKGRFAHGKPGEYVVDNIRGDNWYEPAEMRSSDTISGKELEETSRRLEKLFRAVQDVEFVIEDGKLWIVQSRDAKLSAAAKVKATFDMAEEGIIGKGAAAMVAIEAQNPAQHHKRYRLKEGLRYEKLRGDMGGITASPGAVYGKVTRDLVRAKAEHLIYYAEEPSDDLIKALIERKIAGLATAYGHDMTHEAMVARGAAIPAVAGIHLERGFIEPHPGRFVYFDDMINEKPFILDADSRSLLLTDDPDPLIEDRQVEDLTFGIDIEKIRKETEAECQRGDPTLVSLIVKHAMLMGLATRQKKITRESLEQNIKAHFIHEWILARGVENGFEVSDLERSVRETLSAAGQGVQDLTGIATQALTESSERLRREKGADAVASAQTKGPALYENENLTFSNKFGGIYVREDWVLDARDVHFPVDYLRILTPEGELLSNYAEPGFDYGRQSNRQELSFEFPAFFRFLEGNILLRENAAKARLQATEDLKKKFHQFVLLLKQGGIEVFQGLVDVSRAGDQAVDYSGRMRIIVKKEDAGKTQKIISDMIRSEMRGMPSFSKILSYEGNRENLGDPRKWKLTALDKKYYAEMSQWNGEKLGTELRAFFGEGVLVPINDASLLKIQNGEEFLKKFIDHLIHGTEKDGIKRLGAGMDHYWDPANYAPDGLVARAIAQRHPEYNFQEYRSRYRALLIRLVEHWDQLAAQSVRSTKSVGGRAEMRSDEIQRVDETPGKIQARISRLFAEFTTAEALAEVDRVSQMAGSKSLNIHEALIKSYYPQLRNFLKEFLILAQGGRTNLSGAELEDLENQSLHTFHVLVSILQLRNLGDSLKVDAKDHMRFEQFFANDPSPDQNRARELIQLMRGDVANLAPGDLSHAYELFSLAAMVHDIGKFEDHLNHEIVGARLIGDLKLLQPLVERGQISAEDAQLIKAAVRHHILLGNIASGEYSQSEMKSVFSDPETSNYLSAAVGKIDARKLERLLRFIFILSEMDTAGVAPTKGYSTIRKAYFRRSLVERVIQIAYQAQGDLGQILTQIDRFAGEPQNILARIENGLIYWDSHIDQKETGVFLKAFQAASEEIQKLDEVAPDAMDLIRTLFPRISIKWFGDTIPNLAWSPIAAPSFSEFSRGQNYQAAVFDVPKGMPVNPSAVKMLALSLKARKLYGGDGRILMLPTPLLQSKTSEYQKMLWSLELYLRRAYDVRKEGDECFFVDRSGIRVNIPNAKVEIKLLENHDLLIAYHAALVETGQGSTAEGAVGGRSEIRENTSFAFDKVISGDRADRMVRSIRHNSQPATVFVDAEDFKSLSPAQKQEYLVVSLSNKALRMVVYNERGQVEDKQLSALLKLDRVMRTGKELSGAQASFDRPNSPSIHLSKQILPSQELVQRLGKRVSFFKTQGQSGGTLAAALLWAWSGEKEARLREISQGRDGFWIVAETLVNALQKSYDTTLAFAIAA